MKGCECYGHKTKLSVVSFGVAWGIVAGLCMMLFAWYAYMGHSVPMVTQWGDVYQGYAPTIVGGFIGGAWGFIEGFIFGVIFSWIYNCCLCCCKGKSTDDVVVSKKNYK